jgi:hypothetical protein
MLAKRNIVSIGYIDDFLLICDSYQESVEALQCIIHLIHSLGLQVSWSKVAGPSQVLTFLGIEINCAARTLALPSEKLFEMRKMISTWMVKRKATKKDMQRLTGKLNWCCRIMIGGRTFLRNIINLISKVAKSHHYIRLGPLARNDLAWWAKALHIFHGWSPFPADVPVPSWSFSTDACLSGGADNATAGSTQI